MVTGSRLNGDGGPERQAWTFEETDYLFGSGPLHLIIDNIDWSRPRVYNGQNWYDVRGTEVSADGRVIGPRQSTVRASRLRTSERQSHS
ncbi:hypothetical protein ACIA5D_42615 [Actinoplanes sp. NPDC051513]|uniref:hypothetical protein n=1 Tax=Actinoplanes sp. NPDC051513 TaxID=3363908 RepID=UPI00378839E1